MAGLRIYCNAGEVLGFLTNGSSTSVPTIAVSWALILISTETTPPAQVSTLAQALTSIQGFSNNYTDEHL